MRIWLDCVSVFYYKDIFNIHKLWQAGLNYLFGNPHRLKKNIRITIDAITFESYNSIFVQVLFLS